MNSKRILIVEDEAIVAADLEVRLQVLGYETVGATARGEEAFALAQKLRADIVLMDIQLQGRTDGIVAAEQIRDTLDIPVVFLTAHADQGTLQRARITSPFGYVLKPFSDRDLHVAIEIASDRHASEVQLKRTQRSLATVIESITDGLVVTDESGLVQLMNRAASLLSGWSPEEALTKPFREVFGFLDAADLPPIRIPDARTLGAGVPTQGHCALNLARSDGTTAVISCSWAPICSGYGPATGMVWMFVDRTNEHASRQVPGVSRSSPG